MQRRYGGGDNLKRLFGTEYAKTNRESVGDAQSHDSRTDGASEDDGEEGSCEHQTVAY